MPSKISFCNDCDLMDRKGFEEVHTFLNSINLPAGDSFWLFDPSGGDMGLFTHDLNKPGPQQHWLLDQINDGVLDVLHSAGSYGERFNKGFSPNRALIEGALEFLDKNAKIPRIWTNHGDVHNTQNIGGVSPQSYHNGDNPEAPEYCLDVLLDYGVEYFWIDRLLFRDASYPNKITSTEMCRDGNSIITFNRYYSQDIDWSPNAQNLFQQFTLEDLKRFSENSQDAIYYTHWGCHHDNKIALTPKGDVLDYKNKKALTEFSRYLDDLDISIVRTTELLDKDKIKDDEKEIQRISEIVVTPEKDEEDNFYYNQFGLRGLKYYYDRINGMKIKGDKALDAGCGVGQWSFALKNHFNSVDGIEINPSALEYLNSISEGLRSRYSSSYPRFQSASIEDIPFSESYFDFIFCYGVIFCANIDRSLKEFSRVLKKSGTAYINLNADGWYELLVDERFKSKEDSFRRIYAEPIWNALVSRVGGEDIFQLVCNDNLLDKREDFWDKPGAVREEFKKIFQSPIINLEQLLSSYSDDMIRLLGQLTKEYIHQKQQKKNEGLHQNFSGRIRNIRRKIFKPRPEYFPVEGIGSRNRAFFPEEFSEFVKSSGFVLEKFTHDAGLVLEGHVDPIYVSSFNSHESVWECILRKI